MAKTYNTLTSDVTAGSVLTATLFNQVQENVRNYRVPPLCILRKTATQSMTNGGFTSITFGSAEETYDTDGMHSTSTNTARITPTTAGVYLLTGSVYMSATPSAGMALRVFKNGTTSLVYSDHPAASSAAGIAVSVMEYMNGSTDYVTLDAFYSHSGALTTNASVLPGFQALWLGQVS